MAPGYTTVATVCSFLSFTVTLFYSPALSPPLLLYDLFQHLTAFVEPVSLTVTHQPALKSWRSGVNDHGLISIAGDMKAPLQQQTRDKICNPDAKEKELR